MTRMCQPLAIKHQTLRCYALDMATSEWEEYQEQVARFFQQIGYVAILDARVVGARAEHRVVVLVSLVTNSIRQLWVVECKCWNSRVSKEKVLALQQVVADVGADRGILLTTLRFQPAAKAAATTSNITLTTLEDLAVEIERQWLQPADIKGDQLYHAWYRAEPDDGQAPWTDLFLRRTDAQPVTLPVECVIAHGDGQSWRYALASHDIKGGVAAVCIPYHFRGEPPPRTTYRVVWRTRDGLVLTTAHVEDDH